MNTPAGWYDDGSGRQRWWDGQQWTDQYETNAADPAGAAAPAGAAGSHDFAGAAYPATAAQPAVATKPSIIGLIALGAAALGTILACIPATIIIGWILLPIAFILSIVAFFIRGKKWAPIAAISLSVVGTIIAIVVAIVIAGLALTAYAEEFGGASSSPSPSESSLAEDDSASEDLDEEAPSSTRPDAEDVAMGLGEVLSATGFDSYTEEQLICFGDALVASEMSDESLQSLAAGQDALASADDATILTESLTAAVPVCMTP